MTLARRFVAEIEKNFFASLAMQEINYNNINNILTDFKLFIINLGGFDIESQLRLEELSYRYLESQSKLSNERLGLIVYNNLTNLNDLPTVVFGLGGREEDDINRQHINDKKINIKIVRRFTGGGTVVLDSNSLILSIIAPKELGDFKSHKNISSWCFNLFFKPFTFIKNAQELNGDFVININGSYYKFGGNSMAVSKNYFVHHSSLLWKLTDSINILNIPKRQPSYRYNRSHFDFLYPLSQATNLSPDNILDSLILNCETKINQR